MEQLDILTFKAFKRVGTSSDAAASAAKKAAAIRLMAFDAIKDSPAGLSATEVATILRLDILSVRPRVSQLFTKGLIIDSGRRRRTGLGKGETIWKIK